MTKTASPAGHLNATGNIGGINDAEKTILPWYAQPWPWLLIARPCT